MPSCIKSPNAEILWEINVQSPDKNRALLFTYVTQGTVGIHISFYTAIFFLNGLIVTDILQKHISWQLEREDIQFFSNRRNPERVGPFILQP